MVVDNRASLLDIARDMERSRLQLSDVEVVLLTVGRVDLLNNNSLVWVLERLRRAMAKTDFLDE